jgi:hypothetical protein
VASQNHRRIRARPWDWQNVCRWKPGQAMRQGSAPPEAWDVRATDAADASESSEAWAWAWATSSNASTRGRRLLYGASGRDLPPCCDMSRHDGATPNTPFGKLAKSKFMIIAKLFFSRSRKSRLGCTYWFDTREAKEICSYVYNCHSRHKLNQPNCVFQEKVSN